GSSSLGHSVQYRFDWGDGSNSGWLGAGTLAQSHTWAAPGTYVVTLQARCAVDASIVSAVSSATSVAISQETVSPPTAPTGAQVGNVGTSYTYTAGSAISNTGHSIQYRFRWGDGTDSGWLSTGVTSASHAWAAGLHTVDAQARCTLDNQVVSVPSAGLTVA